MIWSGLVAQISCGEIVKNGSEYNNKYKPYFPPNKNKGNVTYVSTWLDGSHQTKHGKKIFVFRELLPDVIQLLRNTANPQVETIIWTMKRWAKDNKINV
jgi:hypothetical protein